MPGGRGESGIRVGLPSSTEGRTDNQANSCGVCWRTDRKYTTRDTGAGDQPSARVLHTPGRHSCQLLSLGARRTFCEFKGLASYWTLRVGDKLSADAAWSYEDPSPGYEAIRGHLAFYVTRVDACFVDDERVQAQPGEFYGGLGDL